MRKKTLIKVLTGISVGLAACVGGLLFATTVSAVQTETGKMVVEGGNSVSTVVALANQSIAIPIKSAKSLGLYLQYENGYAAEAVAETYAEVMADEYVEEYTEEVLYEEYTESEEEYTEPDYDNSDEWYDDGSDEWYDDGGDDWYDDGGDDWYDDGGDDWYDDGGDDWYDDGGDDWSYSSVAATAAAFAEAYVGVTPYVPAGHTLEGADCSGFTHACYAAAGYDGLSYSDSGQACQGRSVLYEEWLPGDIVVYSGHVGMYVGGGLIVHCPDIGRYAEYANPYYTTILDVRRIIEW